MGSSQSSRNEPRLGIPTSGHVTSAFTILGGNLSQVIHIQPFAYAVKAMNDSLMLLRGNKHMPNPISGKLPTRSLDPLEFDETLSLTADAIVAHCAAVGLDPVLLTRTMLEHVADVQPK